jgi:hypothetical protein
MAANQSIANRRLKPFRQVISERYRGSDMRQGLGRALSEQASEMVVTDASTVLIGSDTTPEEREELIDGFAADISNMSGRQIVAIAIVLN